MTQIIVMQASSFLACHFLNTDDIVHHIVPNEGYNSAHRLLPAPPMHIVRSTVWSYSSIRENAAGCRSFQIPRDSKRQREREQNNASYGNVRSRLQRN